MPILLRWMLATISETDRVLGGGLFPTPVPVIFNIQSPSCTTQAEPFKLHYLIQIQPQTNTFKLNKRIKVTQIHSKPAQPETFKFIQNQLKLKHLLQPKFYSLITKPANIPVGLVRAHLHN